MVTELDRINSFKTQELRAMRLSLRECAKGNEANFLKYDEISILLSQNYEREIGEYHERQKNGNKNYFVKGFGGWFDK